jgi:hypothetical protein
MENELNQATNFALDIKELLGQRAQCMRDREALRLALIEILPKYPDCRISEDLKFADGSVAVFTTDGIFVRAEISLDDLLSRFLGRAVKVTHTGNSRLRDNAGVCTAIRQTDGEGCFDVDLDTNYRFGFEPYQMTETMVVGTLAQLKGERKMELA